MILHRVKFAHIIVTIDPKKALSLFFLSVVFSSVCLSPVYSQNILETHKEKISAAKIYFNRGKDRELCSAIYSVLMLSENKDYLISEKEIDNTSSEEKYKKLKVEKSLFIPHTKKFKDFREPKWTDIVDTDALKNDPGFIANLSKDHPELGDPPVELGKDYRIQKAEIDLNLDGIPEIVYRSTGRRGSDYFSVHFRKREELSDGLYLTGQIVLYKEIPIFLTRELSSTALTVTPSLENGTIFNSIKSQHKFEQLGCTFSSNDKTYIGD